MVRVVAGVRGCFDPGLLGAAAGMHQKGRRPWLARRGRSALKAEAGRPSDRTPRVHEIIDGWDGHSAALDATRDTRLIAMTGWATKESESRTRDAGFDLHLVKPLTVDALTHALTGARR